MNIKPAIAITLLLAASSAFAAGPQVTCHSGTISYKFVGTPGTVFTYSGHSYTVPKSGRIELVREARETTYALAGRSLPLEVWPMDAFGTRTVPLPHEEAPAAATTAATTVATNEPVTTNAGGSR
jgi:hypothetical protein